MEKRWRCTVLALTSIVSIIMVVVINDTHIVCIDPRSTRHTIGFVRVDLGFMHGASIRAALSM